MKVKSIPTAVGHCEPHPTGKPWTTLLLGSHIAIAYDGTGMFAAIDPRLTKVNKYAIVPCPDTPMPN